MEFVMDFVDNDMEYEDFNAEQLEQLRKECEKLGITVRETIDEREFYQLKKRFMDMYNRQQRMQRNIKASVKEAMDITLDNKIKVISETNKALEETIEKKVEEDTMDNNTTNNATVNNAKVEENTMKNKTTNNNATTNTTVKMEGNTMENTTNTNNATVNEEAMAEKAKAFAEASKEKLANGFKAAVENIGSVGEKAKEISQIASGMGEEEFEDYLKVNGKAFIEHIVNKINKYKDDVDGLPLNKFTANMKKDNKTFVDLINDIKETLGDTEETGWAKFKDIVKMIAGWIVKLFLKVASIVLKIAFVTLAGAIKVGFTILGTGIRAAGVLNKEVVKPTVKAAKTGLTNHKERKAKKQAAMDKIEEELLDIDEFDIELTEELVD